MGSEKFPEESDFDAYLKKYGGSSNAYTDCERVSGFPLQQNVLVPSGVFHSGVIVVEGDVRNYQFVVFPIADSLLF